MSNKKTTITKVIENGKEYYVEHGYNGEIFYYKDEGCSRYHRIGGPVIEYDNGTKHWYINGKLHREDGPAIEWYDGGKEWWVNSKRHREDGPAIEYVSGYKAYYLNGKYYEEEEEYWAMIRFGGFA